MKVRRHSQFYNFIGDTETGMTCRWGKMFEDDPPYAPWPELADISISNHCTNGCDFCYRDSQNNHSFMSVEEYAYLLRCLQHPTWGNVFQVALGGGEPLEHPDLLKIIDMTCGTGIIPNFTTNGRHLTSEMAASLVGKVGAVAVSVAHLDELPRTNLNILLETGLRTNIHFLLSRKSLTHAIDILQGNYNERLKGVNGLIFLTHKPAGRAISSDCLAWNDELEEFISLIDANRCAARIGFDACFVPLLLHLTHTNVWFIDPCECAYFSVYIDENLNVKPCSFSNDDTFSCNLREHSFSDIWENVFEAYRKPLTNTCQRTCDNNTLCRDACPYFEEINLCFSTTEKQAITL
ncbi:MAG: radical SAM protein [bacterium]|nr:radical SAM protein [bacterium]